MILTRRANKSRQVVQLSHRVVVDLRKMEEEKEKEKDNRGDALDSKESRLEHGFGAPFYSEIPANELEGGAASRPKNFLRRILTRQNLYLYCFLLMLLDR